MQGFFSISRQNKLAILIIAVSLLRSGLATADDADACRKSSSDIAIAACTRAIESGIARGQPLAIAYNDRGRAYHNRGYQDRAIVDYNEAIRIDPRYAAAFNNRGAAYKDQGQADRAIADYNEAIRLNPQLAPAYQNRSAIYVGRKDYERAIMDCNEAIRLDPTSLAYVSRANAFRAKGDFGRALADFDEAIRLNPSLTFVYVQRGRIYALRRDYDRAIVEFNSAIKRDLGTAEVLNAVCDLWIKKGKLDQAIARCSEAIQIDPKYVFAYVSRCQALLKKNSRDRAMADCNTAARLDPSGSAGLFGRGLIQERNGALEQSLANYRAALKIDPNSEDARQSIKRVESSISARLSSQTQSTQAQAYQSASPDLSSEPPKVALQSEQLLQKPPLPNGPATKPVAATERRMALVIGNDAYLGKNVPKLELAVADAKSISSALTERGFDVLSGYNLTRRGMNRLINDFVDRLSADSVAVVYYSGHGVQVSDVNYLLPIDIEPEQQSDLKDDGIELGRILDQIRATKARFSLAIIDACRNNPLHNARRSMVGSRGLAPTTASGAMILYSAGSNQEAIDRLRPDDKNGLFTAELLKQMRVPGLSIQDMMARVRKEVSTKAASVRHKQMPALYDETDGDFAFTPMSSTSALTVEEQAQKGKDAFDKKDYGEAMRWWRLAADRGSDTALGNIANLYYQGAGVNQDYAEALRWARMAAEKGNAAAMGMIAVNYASGSGVMKDCALAKQWLEKSASAGLQQSKDYLRLGLEGLCHW